MSSLSCEQMLQLTAGFKNNSTSDIPLNITGLQNSTIIKNQKLKIRLKYLGPLLKGNELAEKRKNKIKAESNPSQIKIFSLSKHHSLTIAFIILPRSFCQERQSSESGLT